MEQENLVIEDILSHIEGISQNVVNLTKRTTVDMKALASIVYR